MDPMEALRQKFLARCAEELALFEGQDSADLSAEARRAVHRLAGTAGVFGYTGLGRLALRVDDQLHAGTPPAAADFEALRAGLRSLPGL